MRNTTEHISLRISSEIVEAARREGLRLMRSRSWVLSRWLEAGMKGLRVEGVGKDGRVVGGKEKS